MTDVNEQSFSAGTATDGVTAHQRNPRRQPIPAPIWRFRPALQPIGVVKTIKTQIIPKIVLALRKAPAPTSEPSAPHKSPSTVEQFAALALGTKDDASFAYVEESACAGPGGGSDISGSAGARGAPPRQPLGIRRHRLCQCDAGVSRLQRIMRRLGERFFDAAGQGGGESVLLTIIPGEQHSFGLSMVAEFFRRAGWNLCTGPFSSHQELISLVHNHWFDIVGFSVSSDRRLDELQKDIQDIRRESRNRRSASSSGGPMVIAQPGLVASMGADMMSADATVAPQQALGLIERMKSES